MKKKPNNKPNNKRVIKLCLGVAGLLCLTFGVARVHSKVEDGNEINLPNWQLNKPFRL